MLALAGQAMAASGVPTYMDFYLLLDNTPSMGVGATPNDVSLMVNNTSDKCAFACHDVADPNNYYKLAKKLGVTMRIDVVRSATQQLMDTATSMEAVPYQFRTAFYTFGTSATNAGFDGHHAIDVEPLERQVGRGKDRPDVGERPERE